MASTGRIRESTTQDLRILLNEAISTARSIETSTVKEITTNFLAIHDHSVLVDRRHCLRLRCSMSCTAAVEHQFT